MTFRYSYNNLNKYKEIITSRLEIKKIISIIDKMCDSLKKEFKLLVSNPIVMNFKIFNFEKLLTL